MIYRLHNYYSHFVIADENGTPERLYECYLRKISDTDDHNGLWLYLIMLEHKERRAYRTVTEFYEDEEITLRHSLDYLISMINEAYGVDINPNDYTFVDADTLEHLSDLPATFNIFQPEYSFCFFSRPTDELTL